MAPLNEDRPSVRTTPISATTAADDAELLNILKRELDPYNIPTTITIRPIDPTTNPRPGRTHLPTELQTLAADHRPCTSVVIADMPEGRFYCVTPTDRPWIRFPLHHVVEAAAYIRLIAWDHDRPGPR